MTIKNSLKAIKNYFTLNKIEKLPDFLIIGFAKCGTSSLGHNLSKHPGVFCSMVEEALFANSKKKKICESFSNTKINGEKSPNYILSHNVMKKIAETCPNVKIIICIRHPIQAMHSFYKHRVAEHKRGALAGPMMYSFPEIILNDIKTEGISNEQGNYIKFIKENVLTFFKKEQIKFVVQERMFNDTDKEMNEVFKFLGVEPLKLKKDFKKFNFYDSNYEYKSIDYDSPSYAKAIEKLSKLYEPSNKELFDFLGEEIPEWKYFDDLYKNRKRRPDFLIIGFARCGTTALKTELMKNPNINCLPQEGELFLPTGNYDKAIDLFDKGKFNGEKSPTYILQKSVMRKIAETCPNVKLIVCIRHPIQALHSFYNLKADAFLKNKNWGINPKETNFSELTLKDFDISGYSSSNYIYIKHIKENVLPFFNEKQICVVVQEEMKQNTEREVKKVLNFIGVDKEKEKNTEYESINYKSNDYKEAINKLIKLYSPCYKELFDFLGKPIKEWQEIDKVYYNFAKIDRPVINVFGHRRSGNHFLIQSIEVNFNAGGKKRHEDYQLLDSSTQNEKGIYIVRDGRDVLTSCYCWWKDSGESEMSNIKKDFLKYGFSQYIRGQVEIPSYIEAKTGTKKWDIEAGLFKDPIQRWIDHVESYYGKFTFIKYEDLKTKPDETLTKIQEIIGAEPVKNPFVHVTNLVGLHPRKGVVGDYKNMFTKEDEEFFWEKAGKTMEKLGYKRG